MIACMAANTVVYGLSFPLLALVLEQNGIDSRLIGLNTASQSLAVFLVAPFAPRLIAAFGPRLLMRACIGVTVAAFGLMALYRDLGVWFALRFVLGAAGSLLWIAGEAWVNGVASEKSRGRTIAAYAMAISGGFALGPFALSLVGSHGYAPFWLAAALSALSALPLVLATAEGRLSGHRPSPLPSILRRAPVPMIANLAFAATSGVMLTFFPIYGLRLELSEEIALNLITVMGLGSIALQIPVGWLADRLNRRLLMSLCVSLSVLTTIMMPIAMLSGSLIWLYALVYGGLRGAIYSLAVVLMGETFRGSDLAAASALFGLMWGLGSVVGPPLGGVGIEVWDPHGIPAVIALILLALLPLPIGSWLRSRGHEPNRPADPPAS